MLSHSPRYPDSFSIAFGTRLRSTREARRMSRPAALRELAKRGFVIHADTLRRWELGRGDPTSRQIAALARLYGVSPGAWFATDWRRQVLRQLRSAGWRARKRDQAHELDESRLRPA